MKIFPFILPFKKEKILTLNEYYTIIVLIIYLLQQIDIYNL